MATLYWVAGSNTFDKNLTQGSGTSTIYKWSTSAPTLVVGKWSNSSTTFTTESSVTLTAGTQIVNWVGNFVGVIATTATGTSFTFNNTPTLSGYTNCIAATNLYNTALSSSDDVVFNPITTYSVSFTSGANSPPTLRNFTVTSGSGHIVFKTTTTSSEYRFSGNIDISNSCSFPKSYVSTWIIRITQSVLSTDSPKTYKCAITDPNNAYLEIWFMGGDSTGTGVSNIASDLYAYKIVAYRDPSYNYVSNVYTNNYNLYCTNFVVDNYNKSNNTYGVVYLGSSKIYMEQIQLSPATNGVNLNKGTSTLIFDTSAQQRAIPYFEYVNVSKAYSLTMTYDFYNVEINPSRYNLSNFDDHASGQPLFGYESIPSTVAPESIKFILSFNSFKIFAPSVESRNTYYCMLNPSSLITITSLSIENSDPLRRVWLKGTKNSSYAVYGHKLPIKLDGATAALDNCDFTDVVITGAIAPISPTSAGDCGGNSGITFTEKTSYFSPPPTASGTNPARWHSNCWSNQLYGEPDPSYFPLAQDTALIDASDVDKIGGNSDSGTQGLYCTPMLIGTFDMVGAKNQAGQGINSASPRNGNYNSFVVFKDLKTGVYFYNVSFFGRGNTQTISMDGHPSTYTIISGNNIYLNNYGGTIEFNYDSNKGRYKIYDTMVWHYNGTLKLNGCSVTNGVSLGGYNVISMLSPNALSYSSVEEPARSINFGDNGSFIMSSVLTYYSTTFYNTSKYKSNNNSILSFAGSGTLIISADGTNGVWHTIFNSGYIDMGNIKVVSNASTVNIHAPNGLNLKELSIQKRPATLNISGGSTITAKTWNLIGQKNYLMTVKSNNTTAVTLSKTSGTVDTMNWCSLSYITASGGATWYAGANSTIGTGTTGFTASNAPKTNKGSFITVMLDNNP